MQEVMGELGRASREFLILMAAAIVVPLIVAIDLIVLENGISEISLTETFQELLLLLCVLLYGYKARTIPQTRGALVLITGFFLCLFIRELDFAFDALLWHGAWVWPVGLVFITCVTLAYMNRETLFRPAARFINTRSYVFVLIGFVTLFVFSRIFGSGSLLWKSALGVAYNPEFKSAIQEGLELFSYAIITQGSLLFCKNDWVQMAYKVRIERVSDLTLDAANSPPSADAAEGKQAATCKAC